MRFNHTRLLCLTNSGFLTGSKYRLFCEIIKGNTKKSSFAQRSGSPYRCGCWIISVDSDRQKIGTPILFRRKSARMTNAKRTNTR